MVSIGLTRVAEGMLAVVPHQNVSI